MSARFEVVRTNAEQPWHARLVAANGRIVWHTENYGRRGRAIAAINTIAHIFYGWVMDDEKGATCLPDRDSWTKQDRVSVEIREVDERESA